MARLIEQGKVRYLGLSEAAVKTIRRLTPLIPLPPFRLNFPCGPVMLKARSFP